MTDAHDEILEELRETLAIEPSPDFEARVRMAVAETAPQRGWWMWAAAGVGVAAVVVGVALRPPVGEMTTGAGAAPVTPVTDVGRTAAVESRPAAPAPEHIKPALRRATDRGAPGRLGLTRAPEVLVPAGQVEALKVILLALQNGEVRMPSSDSAQAPPDSSGQGVALTGVAPVIVDPVRIDPVVFQPQDVTEG